ncbi:MAG TPA: 3-phosphoshikimate 1-carboxyvinyltransferase [Desulfomicrobiaceae bacterium]|nr:3-phosphoshikimate 1-carboxyvinyltransferase [Desulfomicrobiaceae bacterium]
MEHATIVIQAPASKSQSHRALIAAALAEGTSELTSVLKSQDLERTRDCLTALGADITEQGNSLTVRGLGGGHPLADRVELRVGESGTTCRLIIGVAAAFPGTVRVSGEGRMHDRPVSDLTDALKAFGAEFLFEEIPGNPPLIMTSPGIPGGETAVSLEQSSQYLSGLLLGAPLGREQVRITVTGNKVVSWPYVALTLAMMEEFGIPVLVEELHGSRWVAADWKAMTSILPGRVRFTVEPGTYRSRAHRVEADWSNTSYFVAAGAIGPEPVNILGVNPNSLQGDRAIVDIAKEMGARVEWSDNGLTVSPGLLTGCTLDMGDCPDLVPTVATMACFAQGQTTIRGVAHLRIKESDRLEGVAGELRKTGAAVSTFADGMTITPTAMPAGQALNIRTHDDHRMAMSMSLLELGGVAVHLDNPGCVAKSFPGFWQEWERVRENMKIKS